MTLGPLVGWQAVLVCDKLMCVLTTKTNTRGEKSEHTRYGLPRFFRA